MTLEGKELWGGGRGNPRKEDTVKLMGEPNDHTGCPFTSAISAVVSLNRAHELPSGALIKLIWTVCMIIGVPQCND